MTTQASATPALSADAHCPCGSGKSFALCCQPLLLGQQNAPTAEALMRSRYTAHAVKDYRYLHRTYFGTAKLPYVEEASDDGDMNWTRLVVHSHELGARPDQAFVDFSAYFKVESGEQVIQEKSEFKKVDGQWYYTRPVREGPAPVKATVPKVGRNDPCPCGSGKKYKQCCL